MEMTIKEAILDLTELKICGVVPFTKGTISGGNYKVITEECLNTAINTMYKYQKICKILDKSDDGELCMYDTIQEIEEVRDGNDD